MNLAPKELSIATLPFGVWYYDREISALTPVGVPSGDGAGGGLEEVRHGRGPEAVHAPANHGTAR